MKQPHQNIISGFVRSARQVPERAAFRIDGKSLSYKSLHELSSVIADTIDLHRPTERLVVVLANRTFSAIAGVTGSLLSGRGYVPINPAFPAERIKSMLLAIGSTAIVAEPGILPTLSQILEGLAHEYLVIVPEDMGENAAPPGPRNMRAIGLSGSVNVSRRDAAEVAENDIAYVIFTSGSTGVPKGVMTSHANIKWMVNMLVARYSITENDRLSLNAELSFSASVLVIFMAFERGGAICCPTRKDLLNPGRFLIAEGITVWKSVPSVVALMSKLHQLRDGVFPTVRITTFGGEPVPAFLLDEWTRACPNSRIEAVYGSTEFTVNSAFLVWSDGERDTHHGIAALGYVVPGTDFRVVDESLHEVQPGEVGELLLAGPHVAQGYYSDEEKTRGFLCKVNGDARTFGRTGDLVRRPSGNEAIHFIGRRDNQVKVLGNRVELGDVEAAAVKLLNTHDVIALGWPPSDRGFDGVTIFVAGTTMKEEEIIMQLKKALPTYMVPQKVHFMEKLPLNQNGKKDRLALRRKLEEGA